jgi:hypothetical protein
MYPLVSFCLHEHAPNILADPEHSERASANAPRTVQQDPNGADTPRRFNPLAG